MRHLIPLACVALFVVNRAPAQDVQQGVPVSAETAAALDRFAPYLGAYEGAMQAFTPEGEVALETPIAWTIERAFFGNEIRMEFAAVLEGGRVGEWLGLFGWNEDESRYTTYWVNSGIRDAGYDLTERELFAERGTFDEAGRTLTLLSKHKTDLEGTMVDYRSTFHFREDGFVCVDEQYDAEAERWWKVVEFTLHRAEAQ
jgi:hypothetical protein